MKYLPIAVSFLFTCYCASADTWGEPEVTDFYSPDSVYFVRVVPRFVPDKYDEWSMASAKRKRKYSPQDTTIVHTHAIMYKRTAQGDSLIWKAKLVNRIAPVSALVSNDGRYFATFDNWYETGYGEDVFVVYDRKGMLIKQHTLEDISPFPSETYLMSISSILWRCGQRFISNNQIEICFYNGDNGQEKKIYCLKELKIK